jgi:hypothetical protein
MYIHQRSPDFDRQPLARKRVLHRSANACDGYRRLRLMPPRAFLAAGVARLHQALVWGDPLGEYAVRWTCRRTPSHSRAPHKRRCRARWTARTSCTETAIRKTRSMRDSTMPHTRQRKSLETLFYELNNDTSCFWNHRSRASRITLTLLTVRIPAAKRRLRHSETTIRNPGTAHGSVSPYCIHFGHRGCIFMKTCGKEIAMQIQSESFSVPF